MQATTRGFIAASLVGLAALAACNLRKPLPRRLDGGPVVELVEAKPPVPGGPARSPGPTPPLGEEHEPNDDLEHAQPLVAGQGIAGSLAAPTALGAGKGDDDYFAYRTAAALQQVRIAVAGSPLADLQLELLTGQGQRMALVDERGRGEPEVLQSLVLAANQTFYLRVRGTVAATAKGAADYGYQLTVEAVPAPPGSEQEPNDTPVAASPAVGVDLTGALSHRRDEDYWVVSLPEAVGRRVTDSAGATEGLRAPAVLRVELSTPYVVPSVRVLVEAAPRPAAELDAGLAPPPDGGAPVAPLLTPLVEVAASRGVQELRLRNLTLPAGSARAFIAVRGTSFIRPPGESRYHLRLTVEPELEDAEVEPNDDCAQASLLKLTAVGGGRSEGELAGFLWPGDLDCFRLRPPSPGPAEWQLKLSLPGGDCQAALELGRGSDPTVKGTPDGAGGLNVRARGELLVRVSSRDRKTCFDAPYKLSARQTPDAGGARP